MNLRCFIAFCACWIFTASARAEAPFELRDGDRVVLVGGTLIEREMRFGYLETALTLAYPDRNVTFRNLGQSGDTVLADARNLNAGWATFGPPDQGFNRLKKLIEEIRPTVIVANFGMTESFQGSAKLAEFVSNYTRLLDMLVSAAGTQPRVVLMSPNFHEDLGRPQPDPKGHNAVLTEYRDALRELAARRGARFVDLFEIGKSLAKESPITDNGLHPNAAGWPRLAKAIADDLKLPAPTAAPEQMQQVRTLVIAKNQDFFNYWRPQNDTYILGYRKREQGQNAVEMPQFLPLMESKEQQIAALRAGRSPGKSADGAATK